MAAIYKLIVLTFLLGVTVGFNVLQVAQVAKIFPTKVLSDIPNKLTSWYKKVDEDDDRLTTSYTFPREYKTTLYKDHDRKTTLVNMFPVVSTMVASPLYQSLTTQVLETSTTLLYEVLNSTVEYQTTPMLNSTLKFPVTVPVQNIGYATVGYQHETLVYPTRINITAVTSTVAMNYTMVEEVDNHVPFL